MEKEHNALPPDTSTGPTVGIEFFNEQATKLLVWIEPACIELELERGIEYRVESEATEYRIVFDRDSIVLYLQNRFGPKVFKRPYTDDFRNKGKWELEEDYSDIG